MSDLNILPAMEDEPHQVAIDSEQAALLRKTLLARKLKTMPSDTPLPLIVPSPDRIE